jgi:hypothetical protein
MRKLLFIFFFPVVSFLHAQVNTELAASKIPDSLKQNANAVYVLEEKIFTLRSASSMKIKTHNIITILNREGRRHSAVQVFTDKFTKMDEAVVHIYDSTGKEVFKFKKKDFRLYGLNDGVSMVSDGKFYDLDFAMPGFPFTIDVSYTVDVDAYLDIPAWFFGFTDASFITSRLQIETTERTKIQYKTYNFLQKPAITQTNDGMIYTWELKSKKISYHEEGSYGQNVSTPWVDVAPEVFNYDGYQGLLTNWKEFGKVFYPFYQEENPFTPERKFFFESLADKGATKKEKIALLYKYLQEETRYVGIQFGIGGYKPFPVSFAEEKKYGDCKGLTHYMKNILQAVGIKSYAAIINAGVNEFPVDPEFAGNRFNHVILCVPDGKDTIWLECTSKQTRPGILSSFTENRYALLITENGGKLVRTPTSKPEDNIWNNQAIAEILPDGGAILKSRLFVSGEFRDLVYKYIINKPKDEIKKALVQILEYKTPDEIELASVKDSAGGYVLNLTLGYYKYFDFKAGAKHFFPLYNYHFNQETIKTATVRKFDYLFEFPYKKTDVTTLRLPAQFTKESIPTLKEVKNNFVEYQNNIQLNNTGNELTVSTHLTLQTHLVPAKLYNEVALVFEAIKKDEGQKIVLKKE